MKGGATYSLMVAKSAKKNEKEHDIPLHLQVDIHARPIKTGRFWNGSILFNPQYICQFLIKSNNQDQFRNPQDELIPKPTLVIEFDQ